MATTTLVIGHRGASARAPENTLSAFALALDAGADGVECDLRATADGVPVVIHDARVDRTTDGSGEIARMALAEVRSLDASGGNPDYRGERIPALAELLALVAGRGLLVLEYKSLAAVAPSTPIVRAAGAASWCAAWSFRPEILAALRDTLPEVSRSLLVGTSDDLEGQIEVARSLGCVGLSLRQDLVDGRWVGAARDLGLRVYAWTADAPADWRRLIADAVDGIVTNDPQGLRRMLPRDGR